MEGQMPKLTQKEIEDQIITNCAIVSHHIRKIRQLEKKLWRTKHIVPLGQRKPKAKRKF
jgi:hypothetical protein